MNPVQGDQPVSWLMFFTFAAVIFIIAGSMIAFLRRGYNRDIAAEALAGNNSPVGKTPNGAAPELIAVGVFALVVMGLLAAGYSQKTSYEKSAQLPSTTGQTGGGMTQAPGTADRPKAYQPANPVPDTRSAPASSSSGVGPDSGGRPENAPK